MHQRTLRAPGRRSPVPPDPPRAPRPGGVRRVRRRRGSTSYVSRSLSFAWKRQKHASRCAGNALVSVTEQNSNFSGRGHNSERACDLNRRPLCLGNFRLHVLVACPCCGSVAVQLLDQVRENAIVTQTRVRIPLRLPSHVDMQAALHTLRSYEASHG